MAAWQERELFAHELRAAFRSLREIVMSSVETGTQIRPFHIEFTEEQIDDLRRRITATRGGFRDCRANVFRRISLR